MVDGVTDIVRLGEKKFIKNRKTVKLTITVPEYLKDEFSAWCNKYEIKMSEAFKTIIEESVRQFRELDNKINKEQGEK